MLAGTVCIMEYNNSILLFRIQLILAKTVVSFDTMTILRRLAIVNGPMKTEH